MSEEDRKRIEAILLDWLHSGNENLTFISESIIKYFESRESVLKEEVDRLKKELEHERTAGRQEWERFQLDKIQELETEMERLKKENAEQSQYLKSMVEINVMNMAWDGNGDEKQAEEWRKDHKVNPGESFPDYFMRVHSLKIQEQKNKEQLETIIRLNQEIEYLNSKENVKF